MQDEILDVGRKREIHAGKDGVVALIGVLDHGVADIVDEIDVVAGAALHQVGAAPAVEQIVAAVAGEHVYGCIAVALQVRAAGQGEVLETSSGYKLIEAKTVSVPPFALSVTTSARVSTW